MDMGTQCKLIVILLWMLFYSTAQSQDFQSDYIKELNIYRLKNNRDELVMDSVAYYAAKHHFTYISLAAQQHGKLLFSEFEEHRLIGFDNCYDAKCRVMYYAEDTASIGGVYQSIAVKGGWGAVTYIPKEVLGVFISRAKDNEYILDYNVRYVGVYYGMLIHEGIMFIFVVQVLY